MLNLSVIHDELGSHPWRACNEQNIFRHTSEHLFQKLQKNTYINLNKNF